MFSRTLLLLLFVIITAVHCKPTVYKKNDNNKLEPVLIPVSSTVIPLPVFKVSIGVGVGDKHEKKANADSPVKLLTANKTKASLENDEYSVSTTKEISEDEFKNE